MPWPARKSWRDDVRAGVQALLLQNQGKINGIWASFDGQAYIIDDLLQAQGVKKGQIPLVAVDGGAENLSPHRGSAIHHHGDCCHSVRGYGQEGGRCGGCHRQPEEAGGKQCHGPYLFVDAVLVDASNVQQFAK